MERLDELVWRWRAAEERLYPVVMVRPEIYERCLRLVRAVADGLGSARTPDLLAEAYGRSDEVVARAVERTGTPTEGMDLDLVAGAAFNLRYREVLAETQQEAALRRVRTARERGDAWVLVHETGGPAEHPTPPYSRLEMHLADGAALRVFVEMEAETGEPVFGIEAVRLDPQTGDRVPEAAALEERRTFEGPGPWKEAIEELRARYGRTSP